MSSQHFSPYVLDVSGYLRKDDTSLVKKEDLEYFQEKDSTEKSLLFFEIMIKHLKIYSDSKNVYLTWESKEKLNIKITPPISLTHKFSPYILQIISIIKTI